MEHLSMLDVDDDRHFKNPYEQFSADGMEALEDVMKDKIKSAIGEMVQMLESTEKIWGKRYDTSVYTGTTGVAYAFYHCGTSMRNIKYIQEAQRILEKYAEESNGKKDISFITGAAGPLALKAVLYTRTFDFGEHEKSEEKAKKMITKLKSLSKYVLKDNSDVPDELLYGRVGYLYAILFVNTHTSSQIFEEEFVREVVNSVMQSGKKYCTENQCKTPLMYAWHEKEYLGGAHGVAGILYLLLQARQHLSEQQLKEDIEPTLQYLLRLRYKSKNFPSSIESKTDRLVHWCHGAPSMTNLLLLAYEVFNKDEYLQAAIDCGDVIWVRGLLKKGYGICHGVSGNAYTFLALYQQTKDKKHLYRAYRFAEWIIKEEKLNKMRQPDRPLSLFEGKAGHLYFLVDLLNPTAAKFPGYTI